MLLKLLDSFYGSPSYTLTTVEPTGELKPLVNLKYRGVKAPETHTKQDKVNILMLERILPPHEQGKLRAIFGENHDAKKAHEAQHAMYEAFVDRFIENFERALKKQEAQRGNEEPAAPIYFYQRRMEISSACGGDIFNAPLRSSTGIIRVPQISVFSGEETQLCDIYAMSEYENQIIEATQQTIMQLSKAAALDISDIFKKRDGGPQNFPT